MKKIPNENDRDASILPVSAIKIVTSSEKTK
jgi:hypothetical protein